MCSECMKETGSRSITTIFVSGFASRRFAAASRECRYAVDASPRTWPASQCAKSPA